MKKTIRRILHTVLLILSVLLLISIVSLALSKFALKLTEYNVVGECINDSVRIIHLSDLHSASFGKGN